MEMLGIGAMLGTSSSHVSFLCHAYMYVYGLEQQVEEKG